MREAAVRVVDRLAVGAHQPPGVRAGRGGRDLLAQHRPDGELGRVRRPGDPPSGRGGHQGCEDRVGGEVPVDGGRVGIQVEERAAARDRGVEVAVVGQRERGIHVLGTRLRRSQCDHARAVRQPDRAAVGAVAPLLDAGHRGGHEVPEEVVREQGWAERQADEHPDSLDQRLTGI